MRRIITFSGAAYNETTRLICERGLALGADDVRVFDDRWLMAQPFYIINRDWWRRRDAIYDPTGVLPTCVGRGFGWFIWKPYIILEALRRCQDGDVVMYVDADTYPISHPAPLFNICRDDGNGMMFFSASGCEQQNWCKRDTFIVMGQDDGRWRFAQHAVGRFMLFEKGPWRVMQFLMEWLTYCLNPLANTFDPSVILPEYPELKEPRCEQAILTNLVHKYGQRLYREACQFGNGYKEDWDLYPQVFEQRDCAGSKLNLDGSFYRNIEEWKVVGL